MIRRERARLGTFGIHDHQPRHPSQSIATRQPNPLPTNPASSLLPRRHPNLPNPNSILTLNRPRALNAIACGEDDQFPGRRVHQHPPTQPQALVRDGPAGPVAYANLAGEYDAGEDKVGTVGALVGVGGGGAAARGGLGGNGREVGRWWGLGWWCVR